MNRLNLTNPVFQALFLGMGLFVLVAGAPGEVWGYRHHANKIAYKEYSQTVFDQARTENKPVFMLLSAVWCYWCTAYSERTLETPEVVGFLNRNFINVFVDLDQRQDLQHLYVNRGIPTTVVFTPEGKEFISFSGLLDSKGFLDGMTKVLADLHAANGTAYTKRYATVRDIRPYLGSPTDREAGKDWKTLAGESRTALHNLILDTYDIDRAGFGEDKKYPLGTLLRLLLSDEGLESNPELSEAVTATLNRIANHLYDPVEGGFFRYADNGNWGRIRYEKMITTNARLVRVFQLARSAVPLKRQPSGERRYDRIYTHSLRFLLDTFTRPEGGFYSSLDGKWPGYYRKDAQARQAASRKPQLDRTVFTAWNAEAIVVLTEVYRADPDPRLRTALEGALAFMGSRFKPDTGFGSYFLPDQGRTEGEGQVADNSWGALAMIVGYEWTGKAAYLRHFEDAIAYSKRMLLIPELGVFRLWNVPNHEGLREQERVAREIPLAPNAVLAQALLRGHRASGNPRHRALAEKVLHALGGLEPDLFDENPNDGGNTYLESFAHLLRAQHLLARLGS